MSNDTQDQETERDYLEIGEATCLGDLMCWMVEQFRDLPKPWDSMSENEQDDWLARCEAQGGHLIREIINLVTSQGLVTLPAVVEQVVFKDGVKAVLKIAGRTEGVHDLADQEGQIVNVLICDTSHLTESKEGMPQAASNQGSLDMGDDETDIENDPLYMEAVAFVRKSGRASISSLQREMRVGYNRAARLIERMESEDVVSEMGENGARKVLEEVAV